MRKYIHKMVCLFLVMLSCSCNDKTKKEFDTSITNDNTSLSAKDILGNQNYLAISYGGYRENTRDVQPSIEDIKEDLKLLSAMGIGILRTYNVQLQQAPTLLKAIRQLKEEEPNFEMYLMLGAWIDCKNAWTEEAPDHNIESEANAGEIKRAVALANEYSDIVKVIAVGNEAMVKWAASYYVQPNVILKWVTHLQDLKKVDKLPKDLWVTSSDNFASWGGGSEEYHVEDLKKLIEAVDFISMHTYPMHDTHYNPEFWGVLEPEKEVSKIEKVDAAMLRAKEYATAQYNGVYNYVKSLGINKPIHIGETGWATISNGFYGSNGSQATDEYKQALYYEHMREWTNDKGMSCFYFEAFDEKWKDATNSSGSENHFGLFKLNGQAKYVLWNLVDQGIFEGLTRNGQSITKTYGGDKKMLMKDVLLSANAHDIKTE